MPISVPALTRRQFLASQAAAAGVVIWPRLAGAAGDGKEADRFALFSDTHIAADRNLKSRGTNMAVQLKQAVDEVLASDMPPQAVLICGDCAYLAGQSGDYELLQRLTHPLGAGSLDVHFLMGNHDHRERFLQILHGDDRPRSAVASKHVTVVEGRRANWFLLDSLDQTNHTPGVLGEVQLQWLDRVLGQRNDRPALVMVHRNPDPRPKPSGLVETQALLDVN